MNCKGNDDTLPLFPAGLGRINSLYKVERQRYPLEKAKALFPLHHHPTLELFPCEQPARHPHFLQIPLFLLEQESSGQRLPPVMYGMGMCPHTHKLIKEADRHYF